MLAEYFSFDISEDGHVLSLPLLLKDYIPNLDNLPNFLMRLGPQVSPPGLYPCRTLSLTLSR
jgi:DNA mismatch repair protein MLH1